MATPEEMYSEKERELLRLREARTASGQLQRSAPAEFMPTTAVGVPGGETIPNPPAPDMKRMVKDTSEAQSQLRKDAPSVLTDEQKLMAGGAAGLGLLGWLASKFISGTDSDQPPSDRLRDRSIRRDPTMDQNLKGPQEPSFLPEPTSAQPQPAAQPVAQTPADDYRLRAFEEDQRRKNELHDLEVQKRKAELEIKKSKAAVPAPVTTAMPVEPTISREQAAARLAEMPEHPNPITKVEQSTLSQIGSSNLAAQTKEAIAEQNKITGKAGAAVSPTKEPSLFETPGIKDVIAKAKKPPVAHEKMPEGWGKGMTWLVNQHGVEGAQAYIDEFNGGKPFASHNEFKKSYAENTLRPKYTDMPKDLRKSRGLVAPPQSSVRMISTPLGGGGYRPGTDTLLHSLNPLKL